MLFSRLVPLMAVKLSSQEGQEFEVPVELAKLSETVKHIMEGLSTPFYPAFAS